jgi:hypothetical protein
MQILRLLDHLIEPSALLAMIVLASAAAMLARRWRLARQLQLLAAAFLILVGILPGGVWLALPLEAWFPINPPLPPKWPASSLWAEPSGRPKARPGGSRS